MNSQWCDGVHMYCGEGNALGLLSRGIEPVEQKSIVHCGY